MRFGRCYRLHVYGLSFAQANGICAQEGGTLMQIRNNAERDYLQSQYTGTGHILVNIIHTKVKEFKII